MTLAKLNKLYLGVQESFQTKVDEDGSLHQITIVDPKKTNEMVIKFKPIILDHKPVHLPYDSVLATGDADKVIFHPLAEDSSRGISKTNELNRVLACNIARYEFYYYILTIGYAITACKDKIPTGALAPYVNENSTLEDAHLRKLGELIGNASRTKHTRHVIGFYTHGANHKYLGQEVNRLTNFRSALLYDLERGERKVWGVDLGSVKCAKALAQLIRTCFPGLNEDVYSHGSNNPTAPFFDSIIRSWVKVAKQLDTLAAVVGRPDFFKKRDYSFVKEMDNLTALSRIVPSLNGNIGNRLERTVALRDAPQQTISAIPPVLQAEKVEETSNGVVVAEKITPKSGETGDYIKDLYNRTVNGGVQNNGFGQPALNTPPPIPAPKQPVIQRQIYKGAHWYGFYDNNKVFHNLSKINPDELAFAKIAKSGQTIQAHNGMWCVGNITNNVFTPVRQATPEEFGSMSHYMEIQQKINLYMQQQQAIYQQQMMQQVYGVQNPMMQQQAMLAQQQQQAAMMMQQQQQLAMQAGMLQQGQYAVQPNMFPQGQYGVQPNGGYMMPGMQPMQPMQQQYTPHPHLVKNPNITVGN